MELEELKYNDELKGQQSSTVIVDAALTQAITTANPAFVAAGAAAAVASSSSMKDNKFITPEQKTKSVATSATTAAEEKKAANYLELYRFGTKTDKLYTAITVVASLVSGSGQPMVALLMSNIINDLATLDEAGKKRTIVHQVVLFTAIGCAIFVACYLQMCFWTLSAENQVKRIHEEYLHTILRQEIGCHDADKQAESLTTRLNSDTQLIYDGMADKGWKLSLVLLACVPLIGACAAMLSKFTVANASKGKDSYSKAGSVAEQVISSIQTVVTFSGQKREAAPYVHQLDLASKTGK
ncbi:MAG: ABC transporter type 1, transmembrane domain-containing protein [Podila humilis]|nr:MAG: ABC transporter type 1, transmembrane domain-containing protein [Podila humilis]